MKQDDNLIAYYSKIQLALDELRKIQPLTLSINDGRTKLEQYFDQDSLIMFLNGLSSQYDLVRDQIHMMDPLPSLNKVFSQLLQIEKQKEVKVASQLRAFNVNQLKPVVIKKQFDKRKFPVDKKNITCEHCKRKGHTKDTCFKTHNVPEWFKDLSDKRSNQNV